MTSIKFYGKPYYLIEIKTMKSDIGNGFEMMEQVIAERRYKFGVGK